MLLVNDPLSHPAANITITIVFIEQDLLFDN